MRAKLSALLATTALFGCGGLVGANVEPETPAPLSPSSIDTQQPLDFDVVLSMSQPALTVSRESYVVGRVEIEFVGVATENVIVRIRPDYSVTHTSAQVMPGMVVQSGPALFSLRPTEQETLGTHPFFVEAKFAGVIRSFPFFVTITE